MSTTKEKIYIIVILLLVALSAQFYYSYRYQPAHEVRVYYNQDEQLNKQIIQTIREADKFVYFAVYTFTRTDIKDALLAAKYKGLKVVGITDRSQYSQIDSQKKIIDELRKAEIPVYEQDHSAIMHLKAVVTDKAYASGSFNWTSAATNLNDEVLEVGRDENIRKQYQRVLEELFSRYGKQAD
jgi:phosphatidylserine/phosphatidylglycerophosphate/cardiolipin synthase-like enzyme